MLPDYIKDFFNRRKISDKVLSDFNISFKDEKIVFPVHDQDGQFLFSKYRRSPLSSEGAKYTYDKGGKVTLYGYDKAKNSDTILVVEGECDCLVAWSHNIPAVTSTGGAMSFQKDWKELFYSDPEKTLIDPGYPDIPPHKEVILCFDNDHAGAEGMVRTLEIIPWAKVLLLPYMANGKDISDYVNSGKNLHDLIKTARHFKDIAEVQEDRIRRIALYQDVFFHDAYLKAHTKVAPKTTTRKTYDSDVVTNAKGYPIPNLMTFKNNKACCLHHAEKTPSLNYYPKDNHCYCFGCGKAFDAIDIYQQIHKCTFTNAVDALNKLK